jgi:hypothetical protein
MLRPVWPEWCLLEVHSPAKQRWTMETDLENQLFCKVTIKYSRQTAQ